MTVNAVLSMRYASYTGGVNIKSVFFIYLLFSIIFANSLVIFL